MDEIDIRETDNRYPEFAAIYEPTGTRRRHSALKPLAAAALTLPILIALTVSAKNDGPVPAVPTGPAPIPAAVTASLTAEGWSGIYDGRSHSGRVSGAADVVYSTDGGQTWSAVPPALTDAGAFEVLAKPEGAKDRTAVAYTLSVLPAPLTVRPDDAFKAPGDPDPALTARVEGLIGADAASCTLTRAPGEEIGGYEISVLDLRFTSGSAENYAPELLTGTLTIVDPATVPQPEEISHDSSVKNFVELGRLDGLVGEDGLRLEGHLDLRCFNDEWSLGGVRPEDLTVRDWRPYLPPDNGKAYFYLQAESYDPEEGTWPMRRIGVEEIRDVRTDADGNVIGFDFTAFDPTFDPTLRQQYFFATLEVVSRDGSEYVPYGSFEALTPDEFTSMTQNGVTVSTEAGYDGAVMRISGAKGLKYALFEVGWRGTERMTGDEYNGVFAEEEAELSFSGMGIGEEFELCIYEGDEPTDCVTRGGFRVKWPEFEIVSLTDTAVTVRISSAGRGDWSVTEDDESETALFSGDITQQEQTVSVTGLTPDHAYRFRIGFSAGEGSFSGYWSYMPFRTEED